MKRLTRKEEEAMKVLWKARRGFVRELLEYYPEPKPHYNTLSSLIRGLEEKGFVKHRAYGKNHQYYPVVAKEDFRKSFMKGMVKDYFGSSYRNVVSFLVDEKQISSKDLKEIIRIIEKGKQK